MPIDPIFWLIAAIGFLVLEGMTFSMVSIWFAAGSAAALLSCLFWPSFRVQAVVFTVVSILCLAAFKPLADKLRRVRSLTKILGNDNAFIPLTEDERAWVQKVTQKDSRVNAGKK